MVVIPIMSTFRRKEDENCLKFKENLGYTAYTQTASLKEINNKRLKWHGENVLLSKLPHYHTILCCLPKKRKGTEEGGHEWDAVEKGGKFGDRGQYKFMQDGL